MVPLARHRRPPALRRPLLGLLCVLCGSVLSLVRGDSDFSQLRPRFPLATRAERARATFPSVFTFEGRERVQGLSPWCIRVRSEDDFSAAGEDEPHTLRCLPSWQVVGVYKVGCLKTERRRLGGKRALAAWEGPAVGGVAREGVWVEGEERK